MGTLQVLILGVSRYDFEQDGKKVRGTSVNYVQLSHANEEDKIGYFPTKASIRYEDFEAFRGLKFPLQANADWTLDMANKRNPVKITGFHDLENVLID